MSVNCLYYHPLHPTGKMSPWPKIPFPAVSPVVCSYSNPELSIWPGNSRVIVPWTTVFRIFTAFLDWKLHWNMEYHGRNRTRMRCTDVSPRSKPNISPTLNQDLKSGCRDLNVSQYSVRDFPNRTRIFIKSEGLRVDLNLPFNAENLKNHKFSWRTLAIVELSTEPEAMRRAPERSRIFCSTSSHLTSYFSLSRTCWNIFSTV